MSRGSLYWGAVLCRGVVILGGLYHTFYWGGGSIAIFCPGIIFMGGLYCVHRGSSMKEAARDVIDVQIPALRDLCDSAHLSIDNLDVFCEEGVFDRDTSAMILRAGQEAGWKINFHGDELRPMEAGLVSQCNSMRGRGEVCFNFSTSLQGRRQHGSEDFALSNGLSQLLGA